MAPKPGDRQGKPKVVGQDALKKIMDQLRELSLDGFEEVMAGVVAPLMVLLRRAAAIHTALKQALAPSLAGASNGGAGEEEEEDAAVAYAKQIEQQSADTLHVPRLRLPTSDWARSRLALSRRSRA